MANLSVNTNAGAMVALQNLKSTNNLMNTTQDRISTGLKVSSVADDSSTWRVAQNIRGDLGGLAAVTKSLDRAKSTLDLSIAAGESVSDLIIRARELAAQSSDMGIDTNTRDAIKTDFDSLMKQIDAQVTASEFNGTNMLKSSPDGISAILSVKNDATVERFSVQGDNLGTKSANATFAYTGTSYTAVVGDNLAQLMSKKDLGTNISGIQVAAAYKALATTDANNGNSTITLTAGTNYTAATGKVTLTVGAAVFTANVAKNLANGQTVTVKADQFEATTGGAITLTAVASRTANSLDLADLTDRMGAVAALDKYNDNVKTKLASWGASAKQLEMQQAYVTKLNDAWNTGIGNLVDADMATESARLQSLQVRQQLGVQALSLANQAPQTLLSLFR